MTPQDQYILRQAASILNVPVSTLLDINRPQNPQYVLEQAARTLRVPLPALIELGRISQQRRQKRPRINSDIPMSSPYLGGSPVKGSEETASTPVEQSAGSNDTHRPLSAIFTGNSWSLGINQSSISNAFRNIPFCPPCSDYETPTGKLNRVRLYVYDCLSLSNRIPGDPNNHRL